MPAMNEITQLTNTSVIMMLFKLGRNVLISEVYSVITKCCQLCETEESAFSSNQPYLTDACSREGIAAYTSRSVCQARVISARTVHTCSQLQ